MDSLKPCPFCGRTAPLLTTYKSTSSIICACGITVTYSDGLTPEEAEQVIIKMWNRRTKLTLWKRVKTFFQWLNIGSWLGNFIVPLVYTQKVSSVNGK